MTEPATFEAGQRAPAFTAKDAAKHAASTQPWRKESTSSSTSTRATAPRMHHRPATSGTTWPG